MQTNPSEVFTPEQRRSAAASAPRPAEDPPTRLGMSTAEVTAYSITRAMRAMADGAWQRGSLERTASDSISARLGRPPAHGGMFVPLDVQERDVYVGSAAGGGYLVATKNHSFIGLLRNRAVVYRLGAQRVSGLVGNVTMPKLTAAASGYWMTSEGATIAETEQRFGQLALIPKTVGAYTEISRQLLLQSSPDVEAVVNADLAAVIAIAVDYGAVNGTGTGGQPLGVVNTPGVTTTAVPSTTYAHVVKPQRTAAEASADSQYFGYVATPAVAEVLAGRQRFAGASTTIWEGGLGDGLVAGVRAMTTNQIVSGAMVFGDWSAITIAEWGVLEVAVNPYANFQSGLIGVHAFLTCDVGIRYPSVFTVLNSIS